MKQVTQLAYAPRGAVETISIVHGILFDESPVERIHYPPVLKEDNVIIRQRYIGRIDDDATIADVEDCCLFNHGNIALELRGKNVEIFRVMVERPV